MIYFQKFIQFIQKDNQHSKNRNDHSFHEEKNVEKEDYAFSIRTTPHKY